MTVTALEHLGVVGPGDDLAREITAALAASEIDLVPGDVLVVASKVVSRAEGRFVDLSRIEPSADAIRLADEVDKDPRLVQAILDDSVSISRAAPGVLITRHKLGLVSANAAIDASNAMPPDAPAASGPWILRLPIDPDASATRLRDALHPGIGVIISDSLGRPFRLGTVGAAIGVSGVPALWDQRGSEDLFGRALQHTLTALADQIAAAADLVAGQSSEARGLIHVHGLCFAPVESSAHDLVRSPEQDLYA